MGVTLWPWSAQALVLVAFHIFVAAMLAIDLGFFHRRAHRMTVREAAAWSIVWVLLSLVFAAGIWLGWRLWYPDQAAEGTQKTLEFLAGYLIEKSLSIDNLFVFYVIFRYFAVPEQLQHRVLLWGVVGALILRAAMIIAGVALLTAFHWTLYILGALLVYTGVRMLTAVEEEIDPGKNVLLRLARRWLRVQGSFMGTAFWVRREGRWYATPLPLVLLVIESTDVLFALDSIPAVFAVSQDPFIVYTSNVFAILGLRALYFLLAGFFGMFRYLSAGLGLVLAFVGLKMLARGWYDLPITWSLAIIAGILAVAMAASWLAGPKERPNRAGGHADFITADPPSVTDTVAGDNST
jgi:tellurite resistance protein TerC